MAGDNRPVRIALRARREQLIEILSEQFAHDAIDVDEFEERVSLAHRATSVAELAALLTDLQPDVQFGGEQVPSEALEVPNEANSAALTVQRPEKKSIVAVFGGTERKGSWLVGKKMNAVAIFGGVDIDFREVELPPGVTELHVTAVMGGIDIIVPPTLAVDCEGWALMGGFDGVDRAPSRPEPDAPLLRIKGRAIMGAVDVVTRLPGESGWQAFRRKRRERKALRDKAVKELEAKAQARLEPPDDKNV